MSNFHNIIVKKQSINSSFISTGWEIFQVDDSQKERKMADDVSYEPISFFTNDALNIVSRLNARRLFLSEGTSKLPRDWRGLANLTGITAQDAENKHENMVKWILETWIQDDERTAVVHHLFRHLETIDRYDIRDDLQQLATINKLVNRGQKWTCSRQVACLGAGAGLGAGAEELHTIEDEEEGRPVEYDALVLYAADDQAFVDLLIANLTHIGFRLLTKHSLRPGVMPYGPMTELISQRCRHTIFVYSNAFFKSLDDKFYTDYVHARNIEKKHKMIPCVYQECSLPPQYRYYFSLYVNSTAYNFWDRLAKVVDAGRTPRLTAPNPTNSVRIQEVSGSQRQLTNGNQLRITNGQIPNGQAANSVPNGQVPNGQANSQPVYVTHPSPSQTVSMPSSAYAQPTTTTIALPDVPSSTLSLSVSVSPLDSRPFATVSLNDVSAKKKKKKSGFSFLKKLRFPRRNKSKEALMTSN